MPIFSNPVGFPAPSILYILHIGVVDMVSFSQSRQSRHCIRNILNLERFKYQEGILRFIIGFIGILEDVEHKSCVVTQNLHDLVLTGLVGT